MNNISERCSQCGEYVMSFPELHSLYSCINRDCDLYDIIINAQDSKEDQLRSIKLQKEEQ